MPWRKVSVWAAGQSSSADSTTLCSNHSDRSRDTRPKAPALPAAGTSYRAATTKLTDRLGSPHASPARTCPPSRLPTWELERSPTEHASGPPRLPDPPYRSIQVRSLVHATASFPAALLPHLSDPQPST